MDLTLQRDDRLIGKSFVGFYYANAVVGKGAVHAGHLNPGHMAGDAGRRGAVAGYAHRVGSGGSVVNPRVAGEAGFVVSGRRLVDRLVRVMTRRTGKLFALRRTPALALLQAIRLESNGCGAERVGSGCEHGVQRGTVTGTAEVDGVDRV